MEGRMSTQKTELGDFEPDAASEDDPAPGQRRLGLSAWRFAPDFEPAEVADD